MTPLPQDKISKIAPLITSMIAEGNLVERSSVEHCMAKLVEGYTLRNMDAYVDALDDPKRVIIFGRMNGIVTKEKQNALLWIYAMPGHRGNEAYEAFTGMMDSYEKVYPCDAWIASDWCYKGADTGMKVFLRRAGFVPQETVYCKLTK